MNFYKFFSAAAAFVLCAAMVPASAVSADSESLGDLNHDNVVNTLDATELLMLTADMAASGSQITEEQRIAADVDGNLQINALDAAEIMIYSTASGTGEIVCSFSEYINSKGDVDSIAVPNALVGRRGTSAYISWTATPYATGYEIYRCSGSDPNSANYQLVQTVNSGGAGSWTDPVGSTSTQYCYKVRAYRNQSNGTIYSVFTQGSTWTTTNALLNGVELNSHRNITVYNRQGASTTSYETSLSDRDIEILEKFAAENFPAGSTREEQLWITMQWIHKNVNYAYVGELWNSIQGMSWTEAVFENKKGQCVQYNGAMAAMMAYLGYDVCMVQGFRGTWPGNYWQHFWPEVNIDGTTYIMECGNYGKSGNWYYFLKPYSQTKKYICNQQNMS